MLVNPNGPRHRNFHGRSATARGRSAHPSADLDRPARGRRKFGRRAVGTDDRARGPTRAPFAAWRPASCRRPAAQQARASSLATARRHPAFWPEKALSCRGHSPRPLRWRKV